MSNPAPAMPPPNMFIPPGIVQITGPLFIAYVVNWGLFGVLSIQTYQYYTDYPNDRWAIKAIVYVAYLLETLQTFLMTSSGFNTFGYGYGNIAAVDSFGLGWLAIPITSGIVAFIAQSFYAYRISVLARSHKFTYPIMFLTVTQLTASMVIAHQVQSIGVWSTFMGKSAFILAGFWEGGSALCDVLITGCMIYYLRKRDTKIKQTQVILARLITLAVGTGAVTALVAIATLLATYIPTKIGFYQVTGAILGKLYSVSMLVVLNARSRTSGTKSQVNTGSHEMHVVLPLQSQGGHSGSGHGDHGASHHNLNGHDLHHQKIPSDVESGIRVHREIVVDQGEVSSIISKSDMGRAM